MSAYYNEIEPYPAEWLMNLARAGKIPKGTVSTTDIREVTAQEVQGHEQAHFFAGIGGWAYALRLAGWGGRPVWTGSCPCQPFSLAGKRKGTKDKRHLWPVWKDLIAKCRPPTLFGEQVASPLGRKWLAGVQADLEALGYRFGAADLCAASVHAPHIRQRLWWVADTNSRSSQRRRKRKACRARAFPPPRSEQRYSGWDEKVWIADAQGVGRRFPSGFEQMADGISCAVGELRAYGNAIVPQVAATFIRAYLAVS